MIVAIHQPDFIPWLGYYYKIAHCDQFVYLDDAQFSNEAAHNYNNIKTSQGKLRIRIPVEQHLGDKINTVRTKDELKWKDKLLSTLEMNYKKSPYFTEIFPVLKMIIEQSYSSIAEQNIALDKMILDGFAIQTPCLKASEMNIKSVREERILDICNKLGADIYLSGNGARAYQKDSDFESRGIKLEYLDYKPIEYKQLWPKVGFIPSLSVIDYIFNNGFTWENVEKQVREING